MKNPLPSIEVAVRKSGGGAGPSLIHYVDVLRWMMGDASTVSGEIDNIYPEHVPLENHFVANIKFVNGANDAIVSGGGPSRNFQQVEEGGIYGSLRSVFFEIPDYLASTSTPNVRLMDYRSGEWTQILLRTKWTRLEIHSRDCLRNLSFSLREDKG